MRLNNAIWLVKTMTQSQNYKVYTKFTWTRSIMESYPPCDSINRGLTLVRLKWSLFVKTSFPFTQGCFGWNWSNVSGEQDFQFCVCIYYIRNIRNYLSLKKGGALQLIKNFNFLYSSMLCAKFGWNRLTDSGKEAKYFF